MTQDEVRNSDEVKIVVGQLSYLIGESLGASEAVTSRFAAKTYALDPRDDIRP